MSDGNELFNMVNNAVNAAEKNKEANGGFLLADDKKDLEEMSGDLKQRIATLKKVKLGIDTFMGDSCGLYS